MISITIDAPNASEARAQMAELLGTTLIFSEPGSVPKPPVDKQTDEPEDPATVIVETSFTPSGAALVVRPRGKPMPGSGRARRTKEEIAEDEAAQAAEDALKAAGEETGAIVADKKIEIISESGVTSEEVPLISTGEDRVDPDNPEDAAADAADEAAETAAQFAASGGKLTLDHVRQAHGLYVQKYGMAAAVEDMPKVMGVKTTADVPEAEIAGTITKVEAALKDNPFKRDVVGAAPAKAAPKAEPAAPATTRDDIKAALLGYAAKYDGETVDTTKMAFTMEDGPKVLELVLGKKCEIIDEKTGKVRPWKVSDLPDDPAIFKRVVDGIHEMTEVDPFKRAKVA